MTIEVEVGGRRRSIDVHRRGSEWAVTLDGRTMTVNVTTTGCWSLLIGPPDGGPGCRPMRSFEVAVDRPSNGERLVHVNGRAVAVSIIDPRERLVRRRGVAVSDAGPRAIVSPMPGRIVKLLVRDGDAVAAQQGLVVIEAMKMENEIRAPRAGRVTAVNVTEGMSVEARTVLVTLT